MREYHKMFGMCIYDNVSASGKSMHLIQWQKKIEKSLQFEVGYKSFSKQIHIQLFKVFRGICFHDSESFNGVFVNGGNAVFT